MERERRFARAQDLGLPENISKAAREKLRDLARGDIGKDKYNSWLSASPYERELTAVQRQFGDRSALAVIREEVRQEIVEENKRRNLTQQPEGERAKRPRVNRSKEPRSSPRGGIDHRKDFVVLGKSSKIDDLDPNTHVVHLASQRFMSLPALARILESCPNLTTIQAAPSWHERLLETSGIQRLLEKKGVKLTKRRIRECPYYDTTEWFSEKFNEKKVAFRKAMTTHKKQTEFNLMEKHGLIEPKVARLYFDERMTTRDIARECDMGYRVVEAILSGFFYWSGVGTKTKNGRIRIQAAIKRARKIENTEKKRRKFERKYKVGEVLLPEALGASRRDRWKSLQELYQTNPEKFDKLKTRHERWFYALVNYFQIEQLGGRKMLLREIGERLDVTAERARQMKDLALNFLGISADTE